MRSHVYVCVCVYGCVRVCLCVSLQHYNTTPQGQLIYLCWPRQCVDEAYMFNAQRVSYLQKTVGAARGALAHQTSPPATHQTPPKCDQAMLLLATGGSADWFYCRAMHVYHMT